MEAAYGLVGGSSAASQLNARRKLGGFGKYGPMEKRQRVEKPIVNRDEVLEQLTRVWKECEYGNCYDLYMHKIILLRDSGIQYTPEDVERFSIGMKDIEGERHISTRAGLFLSALVNYGKGKNYTIHTTHLPYRIDQLGYENTKNITVCGNVGSFTCRFMRKGSVLVNGDIDFHGGWFMSGGTLTIEGTAQDGLANNLRGGTIVANGVAYGEVGFGMDGGTVHLNSIFGSISKEFKSGRIYHNGVLIAGEEKT